MARSKSRRKKKKTPPVKHSVKNASKLKGERLKYLLKVIDCDIHKHLNKVDLIAAYFKCYGFNRIIDASEGRMRQALVGFFNKAINHVLHVKNIKLTPDNEERFSIEDILMVIGLVEYINYPSKLMSAEKNETLKRYLPQIEKYFKDLDWIVEYIVEKLNLVMMYVNVPTQNMYFFDLGICPTGSTSNKHKLAWDCSINTIKPQKIYVNIDQKSRPVYRLAWAQIGGNGAVDSVNVDVKQLGNLYTGKQKQLPVYIQSHAYCRLLERNKPAAVNWVNQDFYHSFLFNFEVSIYRGKVLFTFANGTTKVGYFVGDIIEDKVVIKTFLLMSHASVPEGCKFQELTGLSKYDVNYWNIDKLSTFVNNDMDEDNELYPHFEQSGLLTLFKLQREQYEANPYITVEDTHVNWEAVNAYINSIESEAHDSEEILEELELGMG
ncbi:hypothetical protein [Saccharicrinis aurantiacus]|uniref:hypothetical protein n=1 Tax=Saccharicrinis aurantiacus TaxID=1849719 RepID=UPI002493A012|nr:hypothetical protein [Saccharicrinis aurantiacus]